MNAADENKVRGYWDPETKTYVAELATPWNARYSLRSQKPECSWRRMLAPLTDETSTML